MLQPYNFILKLSLFIIVTTTWLYTLPEVNAQDSGYKQQGPTTKFQTPNSKFHSTFCLPVTDNCSLSTAQQDQVLNLPVHRIPNAYGSRRTPRLNASGYSARLKTLNLKPETLNQVTDPRLTTHDSRLNLELSTSLITGSARTLPFHLQTNRLGTVEPNSTNFLNRIRATGDLYQTDNFRLDYGADLALRISENTTAFFPELYAGAEYRAFRLDFGRFDRPIGLNNHDLSIGSMMVSRNAVPIPRIMLSTPEFTAVPWTNDILEFKAMYSHGWFNDDRYTESPYLHQKYLYLKVNATQSFSLIGGIVHNVFWGGTDPDFGSLPQSFNDYLKIIFASSADENPNTPGGEVVNALGNHLGAYEFALQYKREDYSLSLTRLFYLEDTVSARFRSPWDGVWGVNLKFKDDEKLISAVTYEHINTIKQDSKSDEELGRANYYNHRLSYKTGWTHYGRVIGMPIITFDPETGRVDNNMIIGHHMGVIGQLNPDLSYTAKMTYTRNYGVGPWKEARGTVNWPDRRQDQTSFYLSINYTPSSLPSLTFTTDVGVDLGEYYEDSFGGMVGLRWKL